MTSRIAQEIAEIPRRFDRTECSTAGLLEEAGFPELRRTVSVEDVVEVLHEKPELVDRWLERSLDQRLAGGWGIECKGDAYRIQCYSGEDHLIVSDRVRAVAEFIVRYTRFIGEVQARNAAAFPGDKAVGNEIGV